jgi:hypothetical protein
MFSDDVVAIEPTDGRPVLHPGPPLMNAPAVQPGLEAIGAPIAPIDDETWLAVRSPGSGPQRLAAVFLYSRGDERELAIEPTEPSVLDLVPHVWDIRSDAERMRERFDLLADIIDHAPVYHLSAHSTTPPARIADLVVELLPEGSRHR